jgi:hypothetical protein
MSSKRSCPVCGAGSLDATPFLTANIDLTRLDEFSSASAPHPGAGNHRGVHHAAELLWPPLFFFLRGAADALDETSRTYSVQPSQPLTGTVWYCRPISSASSG